MDKWISVHEKLPLQEGVDFLITDAKIVTTATFWVIGGKAAWMAPASISNITHWMPLPEPPRPSYQDVEWPMFEQLS